MENQETKAHPFGWVLSFFLYDIIWFEGDQRRCLEPCNHKSQHMKEGKAMGFNDAMSGYKKLKNEEGYTNQSLLELLKQTEYSFGTPEMGTVAKKESIVFHNVGSFTVYVTVKDKSIEIGRVVEQGTGKFVLKNLGAAMFSDAQSKDTAVADRAVEELYDVIMGVKKGQPIENKAASNDGIKLYMRQKILSIGDKYSICDLDENPQYWVVGNIIGLKFKIQDNHDNEIMEINKKMVAITPEYTLIKNGEKYGHIKKKIKLTRPVIAGEIDKKPVEITGDITGYHFAIKLAEETIGTVDTERLTWGDVYSIEVRNAAYKDLVVTIAVIADNTLKNK